MTQQTELPSSPESEIQVLGSVLLDHQRSSWVFSEMTPDHFHSMKHADLFSQMVMMHNEGADINLSTLGARKRDNAQIVADIAAECMSTAGLRDHVDRVRNDSLRRDCLRFFWKTSEEIAKNPEVGWLRESFESFAMRMHENQGEQQLQHISTALKKLKSQMKDVLEGKVLGINTGIGPIDRTLRGLQKKKVYVFAGRPGVGKSAIASEIARISGKKVAFFSLEMDDLELAERLVSAQSSVQTYNMRDSDGIHNYAREIDKAIAELSKTNIWIDDNPARTVNQIVSSCRVMRMKTGLDLLVIDYMQYIAPEANGPRYEEVSKISKEIKKAAKILDIPIVVLSSLRKASPGRESEPPTMDDLKETGQIANDAHAVILLHRDPEMEKYDPEPAIGMIVKNRGGKVGKAKLHFYKSTYRWADYDPVIGESQPFESAAVSGEQA